MCQTTTRLTDASACDAITTSAFGDPHVTSVTGEKFEVHVRTLEVSAIFVATLEQFICRGHTSQARLHGQQGSISRYLTFQILVEVLETYMSHWILSDMAFPYSVNDLGREVLFQVMPNWNDVAKFVVVVKSQDFVRWRQPFKENNVVFFDKNTVQDAHTVVRSITRSFGDFYQTHCASMKEALFDMDVKGTGRVHLATFYHRGVDSEPRFGESEDYLRALGALDESSLWHGKQVVAGVVPRYSQSVCRGRSCL